MPPSNPSPSEQFDVGVIGGCGHVGLPLALLIAKLQQRVLVYDLNAAAVAQVSSGKMPFDEEGAPELLSGALASGRLRCTTDPAGLGSCAMLVLIIGTPVDEHLNPELDGIPRAL